MPAVSRQRPHFSPDGYPWRWYLAGLAESVLRAERAVRPWRRTVAAPMSPGRLLTARIMLQRRRLPSVEVGGFRLGQEPVAVAVEIREVPRRTVELAFRDAAVAVAVEA